MKRKPLVVAVLEVMWDWRAKTSAANPNYLAQAPRAFRINPNNFSGGRLYKMVGHDNLLVTNACPQLVSSAKGKGNPDAKWLDETLLQLNPKVLLVCGKVAQQTFEGCSSLLLSSTKGPSCRVLYLPHPAARNWTTRALTRAAEIVQQWQGNFRLAVKAGTLRATKF